MKKKKFIIGGLILFLAIGYLGFMGFRSSASYYFTVSELLAQGNIPRTQVIRVNGTVVPGSVEQKSGDLSLTFIVTEGGKNMPVVYRGVVPDTFSPDGDIVVEGTLGAGGVFQAKVLMPKCPSKYEPVGMLSPTKGSNSWQI